MGGRRRGRFRGGWERGGGARVERPARSRAASLGQPVIDWPVDSLWRSTTSAARAWARRVGMPAWPSPLDGACDAPRLNVALARLVDLKAALLAETSARGPDGSRMRSPQLARCSRDQLRRRMGQHGAAFGRGRGGRCEVFRAPPSLGRQLEAQRKAHTRRARDSATNLRRH